MTQDFFRVMGHQPMLGRTFTRDEHERGTREVVILGHDLWQQRFGGDATILGRTLKLDGAATVVVGIMPPEFDFPDHTQLWTPAALDLNSPDNAWYIDPSAG